MVQVFEGNDLLVRGLLYSDLDSALVTGTWDDSSELPAGSIQLTSWLTALKGTLGVSFSLVGQHRPVTGKHTGLHAFGRSSK
ncbi:hypothetical protein AOXY_G14402 [Acipenser oxyrinchus oxyrinchus]|uniref:Uncharacterized protein n=1 Tax=Acipenser oxyrinchus oxyrinchus TaxID=40147 RepID=A0AAD8G2W7_ACIOX|nr:hypothetical protein AOXY_G14402 [Acipenser oxyrinchus oxyrinchus]